MKFICLGYGDQQKWEKMPERERDAIAEECFAYDDELFKKGYWVDGGQALQSSRNAKTLRDHRGNIVVIDGPFAETKEQLGGFGTLDVRNMEQAIELMKKHPCVRLSAGHEIRPVDEESDRRNLELAAKWPSAPNAGPKFACLGYMAQTEWQGPKSEFEEMIQKCWAYDEQRHKDGQWVGSVALQPPATAKTFRLKEGKVSLTDGPYAETKEWLGGVVILALADMNQAIELLSTHPALPYGIVIEIRPVDEVMNARWEARHQIFKT